MGAAPRIRSTCAPAVHSGSAVPSTEVSVSVATPSATSSLACTCTSMAISCSITVCVGGAGSAAGRDVDGAAAGSNRSGRCDQTYMFGVVA